MNVSRHVQDPVSKRERCRVCNVRGVTPKITHREGSRSVDGFEIEWRYEVAPGAEPLTELLTSGIDIISLNSATRRIRVPRKFEATIIDLAHGRGYWLLIEVDSDGVPGVVAFSVDTMDTKEGSNALRTADDFKRIPFRRLMDEAVAAVAGSLSSLTGGWAVWKAGNLGRQDIQATRRPRGGRGAPIDKDRLAHVAELHRQATEAGEATSKYIAREMKVKPDNARRLVMLARRAGFLPPAGEGT